MVKRSTPSSQGKGYSVESFGEFSRIYQSFKNFNECYESNSIGSKEVFKFCLDNKIKLIYSATSASLGNKKEKRVLLLSDAFISFSFLFTNQKEYIQT